MRENEFERKVHEQLEELRIRPSDETWERVAKELAEKKKRRAAVLFFLLAGLLLIGYSSYTFIYKPSTEPVAENAAKQKTSSPVITETPDNTTTNRPAVADKPVTTPTIDQSIQNNATNPTLIPESTKDNAVTTVPNYPEKLRKPEIVNKNKQPVLNTAVPRYSKNSIADRKTNKTALPASNEKDMAATGVDEADKLPVQKQTEQQEDVLANNIPSDNNRETINSQIVLDSAANTDSSASKIAINNTEVSVTEEVTPSIPKKKNNSKLKLGVEFSGGFVSSRDRAFGFNILNIFSGQKKSMQQSSYVPPGGVTNAPGGTARVIIPPSDIESGYGWKLGLVAEKTITRRSSITAGIRYSHYDESLEVGAIKDTVVVTNSYSFAQNFLLDRGVRGAYSSAAQQTARTKYTNRYHFLELPVSFQTRLNKGNKMGLLWNAGIVPGYMVGTNAIIYDSTAGGIYFSNDRAFKRFHFSVQSGLALQFGSGKRMQWSIGPSVSLDMTRLMKEDVFTDKRYFLYTGLTGRLFFSTRKK